MSSANISPSGLPVTASAAVSDAAPAFSPLYRQIKKLIIERLQAGEWRPGELIPSEMELSSRLGVSQGTVRKAIDELAAEHLVVRRQGKGTFVATHLEARSQFRFLRLKPDVGDASYPENVILEARRMRAPADIARQLDMRAGTSMVFIKRLQSFNGAPTILEELWFPGAMLKGFSAEKMRQYKGPMYALLEMQFGMQMLRATEDIRAVAADPATAELLQVPLDSPLLSVNRVSYTYGERAVEVRRSFYVTHDHYYHNDLN